MQMTETQSKKSSKNDFQHSIVLFSGEDGLPLEFNVRNTNDKVLLKAMIEHGGGMCTQSENAVHLINPFAKALNADSGKKLVSSRYIYDCVSQNYLLDVNDYVFTMLESQTSDISDEDSVRLINNREMLNRKLNDDRNETVRNNVNAYFSTTDKTSECSVVSVSSAPVKQNSLQKGSSTPAEGFVECSLAVCHNPGISSVASRGATDTCKYRLLTSTIKEPDVNLIQDNLEKIQNDLNSIQGSKFLVNPVKTTYTFPYYELKDNNAHVIPLAEIAEHSGKASSIHTAVTSSQPPMGALDPFDNLILNKVQQKVESDEEESSSQSYTVSSSADAQVSSKSNSGEINSGEIFAGSSNAQLDSPLKSASGQTNDRYSYIKGLEVEVERILQKTSPKSIQDKICLVKYICCVKKLPPATVLQSLHSL